MALRMKKPPPEPAGASWLTPSSRPEPRGPGHRGTACPTSCSPASSARGPVPRRAAGLPGRPRPTGRFPPRKLLTMEMTTAAPADSSRPSNRRDDYEQVLSDHSLLHSPSEGSRGDHRSAHLARRPRPIPKPKRTAAVMPSIRRRAERRSTQRRRDRAPKMTPLNQTMLSPSWTSARRSPTARCGAWTGMNWC